MSAIFKDIADALRTMPRPMRQMMLMSFCQWYAMMCYWTYVTYAIARALYHTADAASAGFRSAVLTSGQIGAFYNLVACLAAFGMVRLSAKFSARTLHSACLAACGIAMAAVALAQSQAALFAAVIGIGLGWASIMGNPYVIVSGCIPAARTGIYMGIFNMFIVIPMLIFGLTMPLLYGPVFGGDPRHVLLFGAALMCAAAAATQRITAPA
jgi:maltose/moltooligosaccharide transporter